MDWDGVGRLPLALRLHSTISIFPTEFVELAQSGSLAAGERSFLPSGSTGASARGWLEMAGEGWGGPGTAGDAAGRGTLPGLAG